MNSQNYWLAKERVRRLEQEELKFLEKQDKRYLSIPNDFLSSHRIRHVDDYQALVREERGLIKSERDDAQYRIENTKVHPGQRFALFWSPGMGTPEKVTTMERWDELAKQDKKQRRRLRSIFVSQLTRQ